MAPVLETNVSAIQKELILYEKGIPELLEVDAPFWSLMEKTDSDPASNRATRVPLLDSIKGEFRQADMDNADLGGNSGPNWIVATLTPIYFTSGYGISAKAVYAAQGAERGVKNPWQELVRLATKQFRSALDMVANTGGNGVLGTVTAGAGTAVLTLTTDGFKSELFYVGMPVQVFDSALAVDRGSTTVSSIDRDSHIVTLASSLAGAIVNGDKLVIEGLAAPVTIQSSLFGIQYHQSDATSGLWMNINRATQANVRTPSVNAASSNLSTAFIRRARNKIREYIGDENNAAAKLLAYMQPAQADSYEALAVNISLINKQPTDQQGVDLLFNNEGGMTMAGVPIKQSIHADRTRIDFLCLKYWQRIQATDTGYYRPPGSDQFVFPTYNSSADGLKSSSFFYLKTGLQIVNRNPLAGTFIKTLNVPALY